MLKNVTIIEMMSYYLDSYNKFYSKRDKSF